MHPTWYFRSKKRRSSYKRKKTVELLFFQLLEHEEGAGGRAVWTVFCYWPARWGTWQPPPLRYIPTRKTGGRFPTHKLSDFHPDHTSLYFFLLLKREETSATARRPQPTTGFLVYPWCDCVSQLLSASNSEHLCGFYLCVYTRINIFF